MHSKSAKESSIFFILSLEINEINYCLLPELRPEELLPEELLLGELLTEEELREDEDRLYELLLELLLEALYELFDPLLRFELAEGFD